MDEEVGVVVGGHVVLGRARDRNTVIVLRSVTAYTTGYELEMAFVRRMPGRVTDPQRWDNLDLGETGLKLGFAYRHDLPAMYAPRQGTMTDEPAWNPNGMWGGFGGDENQTISTMNARFRVFGANRTGALTVGWSWQQYGVALGQHTIDVPNPEAIAEQARNIWE
jgi:hypothetical protein